MSPRIALACALCFLLSGSSQAAELWPLPQWEKASPASVGLDEIHLAKGRDYALSGGGSGYIIRGGKLVYSWGDARQRYDLKSTSKSIGVTALGLAIADKKIRLEDKVLTLQPALGERQEWNDHRDWLAEMTIFHLATQSAGFDKPGGYGKLLFAPGSKWSYSDAGPNWLAECITLAYHQDASELLFERIFTPLGITKNDLSWRKNSYRPHEIEGIARREFGSGVSANVDAMARLGLLYLRGGRWNGKQLLPAEFVVLAGRQQPQLVGLPEEDQKRFGNASDHYGLLWWNNADGTLKHVPRDAFWSWGLYESLIVVIPSLDMVVARAGKSWKGDWSGHYDKLVPFFQPIVAAAKHKDPQDKNAQAQTAPPIQFARFQQSQAQAPYPPSPVIQTIDWAPASTIVRRAKGSDNWPITWGDDDFLYTAYGDGRGFEPFVEKKLSMGLARIAGGPADFEATNLRSPTAERTGQGAQGPKVSSMLMAGGVLYMLVRNTDNSQLAWSRDHGQTWTWSDWKFTTSFGYPVFLNFGRNYAGARDGYVYIYSQDIDNAYRRADQMVLARAPLEKITNRAAYEFFAGTDGQGELKPRWTPDVRRRAGVFENPGACYRCSVSYHAGLKRYLWCQTGAGKDTRFRGGFAIYDAPEPWGPWTTVFYTNEWDVGPGETACLPTKWMSEDGKTLHLVFSGDDHFSLRQGTLVLRHN